jgi:hypothetical protein
VLRAPGSILHASIIKVQVVTTHQTQIVRLGRQLNCFITPEKAGCKVCDTCQSSGFSSSLTKRKQTNKQQQHDEKEVQPRKVIIVQAGFISAESQQVW